MAASDYVPILLKNRLHLAGRPQMYGQRQEERADPYPAVVQATRTEFGRPRSSMRLRTSTAMATSVT